MGPSDFIRKWEKSELKESAAAQSHFVDLCRVLEVEAPTDADAVGDSYCFEKGATKITGGQGFADVWKKHCFGWEYKGPRANLDAAYAQLQRYAVALENPPLLIVSDTKTIIVRTNWTNTVSQVHSIALAQLLEADKRELLRNCFLNPEALKPKRTRDDLTREAADEFSALAQRLRNRGHDAETVAHFVNRLVFCMFAEDVGLLPNKMFERAIEHARKEPEKAETFLKLLFGAMNSGGPVGFETVPWFNGGLFDDDQAIPLTRDDLELVHNAAKLYWADIDPSILGTLFERGLDPSKRSQLGAHYTDREKIMMIIRPAIIDPLEAQWADVRSRMVQLIDNAPKPTTEKLLRGAELAARTKALNEAERLHRAFSDNLSAFRVLDPACGSGNFLYLSLKALKDIEHKTNIEAEALGLPRGFPRVGPDAVKGIEINPYAAELARVSVWIGEIQWMRANGFDAATNPILKPLDNIECRDALLERGSESSDWREANWPPAQVIVGNPPFLGAKKHSGSLPASELEALRELYGDRVKGLADLVVYWFVKAGEALRSGNSERFGFVATNSIRDGASQETFAEAMDGYAILNAHSDEPWVVDGASVRVSTIVVGDATTTKPRLDGVAVDAITSKLRSTDYMLEIRRPKKLKENENRSFIGIQKNGEFDVPGDLARRWMIAPANPNGKKNFEVLRPLVSGRDIVGRDRDRWIVDFTGRSEVESALFEAPFEHIARVVKPERKSNRREARRKNWWLFGEVMPRYRSEVGSLKRYLATSLTSKHRFFAWIDRQTICDSTVVAIAREDDTTFGILHSRFHQVWALNLGAFLGVGNDPRYTPSTTFETFPFPHGLTPDTSSEKVLQDPRGLAIAQSAARLNALRQAWLYPPELLRSEAEVAPGFGERFVAIDATASETLAKRTLTNLYNEFPTWLANAHRDLDRVVAAAYGWSRELESTELSNAEIIRRLIKLNQDRAAANA